MSSLPIETLFPALRLALSSSSPEQVQNFIVGAPPGAGKSTALPLFLLKQRLLDGLIIMLEPRRLAARSIAHYLAAQLGEQVGEQVGYQMRGERALSANTRLLIVTEGVLTRRLQHDPELSGVAMVIFDEFHERSLQADLGLALAIEVQQVYRNDLKLMVMSATLDIEPLSALLEAPQVLISEGRSYPIEYFYHAIKRDAQWLEQVALKVASIYQQEQSSILVFLPGSGEINRLAQRLGLLLDAHDELDIYSLYGQLSLKAQQSAIAPSPLGRRKIVLATNIAETSLTIDGIHCVIDSGLERVAQYHPLSGTSRLQTRMISRASGIQRAGRAGRLSAGRCYRLYSEEQFNHRPFASDSEIMRSDLSDLALELMHWGAAYSDLAWLDMPPKGNLAQAHALLVALGLQDQTGLSAKGRALSGSGLSPRLGAMLLQAQAWEAQHAGILYRACQLSAVLDAQSGKREFNDIEAQRCALQGMALRQYQQRLTQLVKRFRAEKRTMQSWWDGVLLAQAFPDRVAIARGAGRFNLAAGFSVSLEASSPLATSHALVMAELYWPEGQRDGKLALGCALSLEHLKQLQASRFAYVDSCQWSSEADKFIAQRQYRFDNLVLSHEPGQKISGEALIDAWAAHIRAKGLSWLPLGEDALEFLARVRCAIQWFAPSDWPSFDDADLLENMAQWLLPHLAQCHSWQGLKKCDFKSLLMQRLSWAQQQTLNALCPSHYVAPSKRSVAIRYCLGSAPVVSLKLQEMFGEPSSPMLGNKIKLSLELLSPAGRPLQVTQDLASFWQGAYVEVKKEMKGRYPKHPWPDDPTTAVATQYTKRRLAQNEGK